MRSGMIMKARFRNTSILMENMSSNMVSHFETNPLHRKYINMICCFGEMRA